MAQNKNPFSGAEITGEEWNRVRISNVATRPNQKSAYNNGKSAGDTKALFDAPLDLLRERHNKMVDYAREEEGARASAEEIRRENEYDRNAAETARIDSETQRNDAELERQTEEDRRYDAEIDRNNNEEARKSGEVYRVKNENARIEAEERRNALAGDLDAALDELHAYAQALIGGGGA